MQVYEWIISNWPAIVVALLALVGLASAITKLTPTPKDDKIVSRISNFINALALNNDHKNKK